MDSFELNKIIGAVLGTLLFVMGAGFVAEAIYEPIEGQGPGYELPEPEGTATHEAKTTEPEMPLGMMMASANMEDGKGAARKCQSCHTFTEGGANGQGPNLWGIVGRPVASHAGFYYSPAILDHAKAVPAWSFEELNAFLIAPKSHVPGTKMNFAGVKNAEDRVSILVFLSTLAASPMPFPPAEEPPAAPESPTEGAEPAPVEAPASDTPTAAPADAPAAAPAETPAMAPAETVTPPPPDAATTTTTP